MERHRAKALALALLALVSGAAMASGEPAFRYWVEVAAHAPGLQGSAWRTDLVLLNPGDAAVVADIGFCGGSGRTDAHLERHLAPGAQDVVVDVVGSLGRSGVGALEVVADQPLLVTSRTYTAVPAGASCLASGLLSQSYDGWLPDRGLTGGDTAWVMLLAENGRFRSNLAFANAGPTPAEVDTELLDAEGHLLAAFSLALPSGTSRQEPRVFRARGGQTDLAAGSARVRVRAGTGVHVSGSLVDQDTNSPLTLPALLQGGAAALPRTAWLPVAVRGAGAGGVAWHTDLGLLNTGGTAAEAVMTAYFANGAASRRLVRVLPPASQLLLADVLAETGIAGLASIAIEAPRSVLAVARTFGVRPADASCAPGALLGQLAEVAEGASGLAAGQRGWLPGLAETARTRTNLSLTNTGNAPAVVDVELHDAGGSRLAAFAVDIPPAAVVQHPRVFRTHAGADVVENGYISVRVLSGAGVLASASRIDEITGEPATVGLMTAPDAGGQLPPPTLSLPAGTYPGPLQVTITAPVGAALRYTTDGSTPGEWSGQEAGSEATLALATHTTVRAIAVRPGWIPSPIAEAAYAITYPVGGDARRLTGPLTLRNQDGGLLAVAASGPFTLPAPLLDGTPFRLEVATHPAGQRCVVRNGAGTVQQAPVGDVEVVCRFDTNVEDRVFLFMDPADLEELYRRDPFSDEGLPGTARFELDGPELALREIRFRGSSSRTLPKKSFRVRFQKKQDALFGATRANFNASYTDPSAMREALAMSMFELLGRPGPRTRHFDLYMNEVFEGLYLHIDRIDLDLVERFGLNPDGTLVRDAFRDNTANPLTEGRWSAFGFDIDRIPEGEHSEFLESTFEYEGDPEWARLAELLRWVHATPAGPEFATGFKARFDLECFLDWLAIHVIAADLDSFWNDYWLYLDHQDPKARWIVIPWDKDLTFGSLTRPDVGTANDYFAYDYPVTAPATAGNALITGFFATPELVGLLRSRVEGLLAETFTQQWFDGRVAELADRVRPSVEIQPVHDVAFELHPANHHGAPGHFDEHIETLREFYRLRTRFITRTFLAPEPGPPYFAIADLTGARAGDEVYLTGTGGWTIARLRLTSDASGPGPLTVVLQEQPGIAGVNRLWRFASGSSEIDGELTLYYRNDTLSWLGLDNWVTDSSAPVGNQWNLTAARYDQGHTDPLPSRVNPFVNSVTTTLTISGPRDFDLALVYK